jgi:type II secretory pathway pseudopilin PulG
MIFDDMKRMISKKNIIQKNKKAGFTLVEMIVTLVITIVIIGVSSSIIISTTNVFGRSALRDMQQSVAETVLGFSTDRMLYAVDLKVKAAPEAADAGKAVLGINTDGQLVYLRAGDTGAPINVFGDNFYSNYRVSLSYSVIKPEGEGFSVVMNAELTDNRTGKVVLNRTMTRPLLNYRGEITGNTPITIKSDSANRYIIIS